MKHAFRLGLLMAVFQACSLVAAHICDVTPNQTVVKAWWGLASVVTGLVSIGFLCCLLFGDEQTQKPADRQHNPRMPEIPPPPPKYETTRGP